MDVETMLGSKVNNTHSFPCVNWTLYIFVARRRCLYNHRIVRISTGKFSHLSIGSLLAGCTSHGRCCSTCSRRHRRGEAPCIAVQYCYDKSVRYVERSLVHPGDDEFYTEYMLTTSQPEVVLVSWKHAPVIHLTRSKFECSYCATIHK
jgi:hypothetical protein